MKKKIIWLILSGLMVSALLLASCAPAVTEEEVAPPREEEVVTEEEVAPRPEGPQYGGVINYAISSPNYGWDQGRVLPHLTYPLDLTHEGLVLPDWARGPAGTGEFTLRGTYLWAAAEGWLAESWEVPDEETLILHVRKGVHFQDKPPVNGRELTANDMAYTIHRMAFTAPMGPLVQMQPVGCMVSVEATDKYTVVCKYPAGWIPWRFEQMGYKVKMLAQEAGGDTPVEFNAPMGVSAEVPPGDFRKWENCIGTGPFIVVDEVPSSSVTFVRNPNYWRKDPVHPENTLPYVDRINWLVIIDDSTRLAALRTGKVDVTLNLSWEDEDSLLRSNPELQFEGGLAAMGDLIGMRIDKPELPFDDIRVRRALAMGLDRQAIARDYYGGNAVLFSFPIPATPSFKPAFIPLDELPEPIQELYEYNPEKARELLAEAGYPDGFKTEIVCNVRQVDLLSVLKAMWADIGVDMEIDVREFGVLRQMSVQKTHEQMFQNPSGPITELRPFQPGSDSNTSCVSDPYLDGVQKELAGSLLDWDEACQILREQVVEYVLEQCYYVDLPAPYRYSAWQPWIKGYHGEMDGGYSWLTYLWLDQELKKEMTGR